jgi:hypothetical protein
MKRQDYVLFFVLIALLFAWPNVYKKFFGDDSLPAQVKPEQPLTETGASTESRPG